MSTAAQNIHVFRRKSPLHKNHFFEWLKTANFSTACGTVTLKSLPSRGSDAPHVRQRLRKHLARCTLDCGFKTPESPALRGFEAERCPIRGTSLYLVLKSNGLHHSENLPVKFGFSLKIVPATIAKKLPLQLRPKPFFIAFFSLSHKRPTLAFSGENGYTLGFRRKIAHKGLHGETGAFRMGALLLPSERSARSQTSPGRVSERQTLPLWGLAGGTPEERREPSGQRCAYARRCSEASRPRWAAQLYLFIGVFTFVKDLAGCCQYSSPITKGAADSNIRIGTLSGHDQNTPRRSKIQKLNAMRQHIRVLQCMALRLSG